MEFFRRSTRLTDRRRRRLVRLHAPLTPKPLTAGVRLGTCPRPHPPSPAPASAGVHRSSHRPYGTATTHGRQAVPSSGSLTSRSSRTSATARPSPTNPRDGKRLRPAGRLKSNRHQSRSMPPPEKPRAPSSRLKSARNAREPTAPPYASDARNSASAGIARTSPFPAKPGALTVPRSTASDNAERHWALPISLPEATRGNGWFIPPSLSLGTSTESNLEKTRCTLRTTTASHRIPSQDGQTKRRT